MSSPEPEEAHRPVGRAPIGALVTALVVAGVFGALWLTSRSTDPQEVDRALAAEEPAARGTAEEILELLINLDAENVDETGERVLELSTGNFREDYEELLPGLGPAFEESGASATGEILEGPEVSFTASDEAWAVARIAQTTTVDSTERAVGFAVRLRLVRDRETWKADAFELLGEL